MSIKFGTDGWRGVIAETFTFENLRLASQAVADYWRDINGPETNLEVVIGFDTRFLSDRFAAEVARVMAANGITAHLARAGAGQANSPAALMTLNSALLTIGSQTESEPALLAVGPHEIGVWYPIHCCVIWALPD